MVELEPLAVEVVRIAFGLGIVVSEVRDKIEQRSENSPIQSWSVVVSGIQQSDVTGALDQFHQSGVSVCRLCQFQ